MGSMSVHRRSLRASAEDLRALPLRAHAILADVPLHDVWRLRLRGGTPGRVIRDAIEVFEEALSSGLGPAPRMLFAIRKLAGRAFRWEREAGVEPGVSYASRLTGEDRARSMEEPGAKRRFWTAVYTSERETIGEIVNRTVHAFIVLALGAETEDEATTLYLAIYVKPVGRFTRFYMAAIDPARRYIIYPSLIRWVERAWASRTASPMDGKKEAP